MNVVDIIAILVILLGGFLGYRKGAIKGFIQLVGCISIAIVSYVLKDFLANFLMKFLPFINFGGAIDGVYSINILLYHGAAFIIMFILLYCVLNILLEASGICDWLSNLFKAKFGDNKILNGVVGAVVGIAFSVVFIFVSAFFTLHVVQTQKPVMESKIAYKIVERTPILTNVFAYNIVTCTESFRIIQNHLSVQDTVSTNVSLVQTFVRFKLVDAETIMTYVNNGKLHMDNFVIAS